MSIIKLNNRALRSATAVGTTTGLGDMTFIKKLTASSSSTLSFVDGSSDVVLDNTYKEYIFIFNNLHTSASSTEFTFKASTDSGSNYGISTMTTSFMAEQGESDDTFLGYRSGNDAQNSTGVIPISENFGNDNDQSGSGYMHLFDPSSTTFTKHFIAQMHSSHSADYADHCFVAGYINTTSAVDAIQFAFGSGNIDAGTISLYGIN
jgi:hypothetical protein